MAQWTVEGANKKTGRDMTILVEAPNAEAARVVASEQGVIAAEVRPSEQHETVQAAPLSYQAVPVAGSAQGPRALRRAIFALNVIAGALYVVALLEAVAGVSGLPGRSLGSRGFPTGIILGALAGGLFSALKTAIFGALIQTTAALLPLIGDRLARPRPPR